MLSSSTDIASVPNLTHADSTPSGLARPTRARTSLMDSPLAYAIGSPLLTVLGAGTMVAAPWILTPAAFGQFALLSSVLQITGKADLGLSHLADRDLGARAADQGPGHPDAILRARGLVGLIGFLVFAPVFALWAAADDLLTPLDAVLALAAGAGAMVAIGPVTIYRAQGRIRAFTAASLALQAGMTAPRLIGLLAAGVTGCFTILAAWYAAAAAILVLPAMRRAPRSPIWPLVRASLPMFAFAWIWLAYLLANRWISAGLTDHASFGLFAFGANLAFTAVGVLASVAQVRYPVLLARIGAGPCPGTPRAVEGEAALLAAAVAALAACAIPLVPPLVAWGFPHYRGADAATMIQAVACVPLSVAVWYMPVIVATARSPLRDAAKTLWPGFVVLPLAMAAGEALAGIDGQAWGCVAGAMALLAGTIPALARIGALDRLRGARLFALVALLTALLSGLAAGFDPGRAQANLAIEERVPPEGWPVLFQDRFETLNLWDRSGGTWQPAYPWGARTNETNGELQYYVDPRPGRDSPDLQTPPALRIDASGLVISGRPLRKGQRTPLPAARYLSGMLTTHKSFSFTYGYAEIEARIPAGRGVWPAFWLLPTAGGWPPEIDVMEALGDDTHGFWATVHSKADGRHIEAQDRVKASDLSQGFHTYGVRWTAQTIDWFLDGRRVFSTPTASDLHAPMYLLLNLAIGGKWPGSPDAATPFPAEFAVRRITVHGLPPAKGPQTEAARP